METPPTALTSLAGKHCLVTGSTGGIGKATARALLRLGARVTIVARSPARCDEAVTRLRGATGCDAVDALPADLSSQTQVRALAAAYQKRHDRLDVLINNAGGVFWQRQETADGIEATFALNHLAAFLLTRLLLPVLQRNAPARIVNVSSATHTQAKLDPEDWQN